LFDVTDIEENLPYMVFGDIADYYKNLIKNNGDVKKINSISIFIESVAISVLKNDDSELNDLLGAGFLESLDWGSKSFYEYKKYLLSNTKKILDEMIASWKSEIIGSFGSFDNWLKEKQLVGKFIVP